jgi:hypothetical protein
MLFWQLLILVSEAGRSLFPCRPTLEAGRSFLTALN